MADGQRQPRLVGQSLQLPFPQPQSPAVTTAAIGGDQQSPRGGIQAAALSAPPTADRSHRERARVVVRAHVDEAKVAPEVVDSVRIGAGHFGLGKSCPLTLSAVPLLRHWRPWFW